MAHAQSGRCRCPNHGLRRYRSDNLEAKAYNKGTLYLDGFGTVDLSDNVNNVVNLSDGSILEVHGGMLADTITASATGNLLDGGGGNDTLIAGNGGDEIRFATGFDVDTVINFNAAADTISLEDFSISDWNDLLSIATESGGDTTFDFGKRRQSCSPKCGSC